MNNKYRELMLRKESQGEAVLRLTEIMKILRVECPWDRIQTHQTLTTCMIEEAYEVVDAINRENTADLREELGDVLLQVVFHSELSDEEGNFNLIDVTNDVCDKMIRRHPHIFYEEDGKSIDKVLERWENIKSEEHGETTYTQRLEAVPKNFPALMRSAKVQKRGREAGFDRNKTGEPLDRVADKLKEFSSVFEREDRDRIEGELGNLLFYIVNLSVSAGVNPETALNRATDEFTDRFSEMEDKVRKSGHSMRDMDSNSLEDLWRETGNRFRADN